MIAMSVLSQGGPMGAFHRCEDCQEGEDDCGEGGYFAQISDSGPIAWNFSERCFPSSESAPMREQRSLSDHCIISQM